MGTGNGAEMGVDIKTIMEAGTGALSGAWTDLESGVNTGSGFGTGKETGAETIVGTGMDSGMDSLPNCASETICLYVFPDGGSMCEGCEEPYPNFAFSDTAL